MAANQFLAISRKFWYFTCSNSLSTSPIFTLMAEETILIVTDDTAQVSVDPRETRSWESPLEVPNKHKAKEITVEKLEQEMTHFLQVVGRLFNRAEQEAAKKPGMQLDEIELSVEISGEGKVMLMGTGAKAAGKGAITLKFKRVEPG